MPFDFEEFPVYKDALKYISDVDTLINKSNAKISASLLDQLNRDSFSITLNIAEGAGRFYKADKRNFYVVARGSVYECVACLQIMLMNKTISEILSSSI